MVKQPITPVMKSHGAKLEAREADLRKKLERLHKAHGAEVADIVQAAYAAAEIDGRISHANLLKRIDSGTSARLARDTKALKSFADSSAFPFSVLRFDRLNKLEAVRADFILSELRLAHDEEVLILAHLTAHTKELWEELEEWLDYYGAAMTTAALAAIVADEKYPIRETLLQNHIRTAEQSMQRMERALVRGASAAEAEKDIAEYTTKQAKTRSDAVLFYEGTRTMTDTVKAVTADIAPYFRSVTEDERACKVCKDIENQQLYEPLPIDDMRAGETAPPFHNYCRCYIEVIYNDDN